MGEINIQIRSKIFKAPDYRTDSGWWVAESIDWFIEGRAFYRSYDSAPPPHLLPPSTVSELDRQQHKKTEEERQLADKRGGKRGVARSRIILPQESLVLYKSFNTLWVALTGQQTNLWGGGGGVSIITIL